MNNLDAIKVLLLEHYRKYPQMRIQDMVKLIYQNEFAGGHLITDETDSLERLQKEIHSLQFMESYQPHRAAFEDIGNGLSRLSLVSVRDTGIKPETMNRFFVHTANTVRGSIKSFEEKLDILRQCCKEGELPFQVRRLEACRRELQNGGYPPIHHSDEYRKAYLPAYRIVRSEFGQFFEIFRGIDCQLKSRETVTLAIDGNSGAGKSTLASLISSIYDCNLFHMDHFFLPTELKTEERLREPGGNVDYVRFQQEVAPGLQSGCSFQYRIYDCATQTMDQTVQVFPKKLNVVEGSYSMHPLLKLPFDIKVFLRINEQEQCARILKRNGKVMLQRFLEEWIPMENLYFQAMLISSKCDLVYET